MATVSPPSFILVAANNAAANVTEHESNRAFRVDVRAYEGLTTKSPWGLRIDFNDFPGRSEIYLGRNGTDIYIPEWRTQNSGASDIQDIQASFYLREETGAVLLCDYSGKYQNTEPHSSRYATTIKLPSSSPGSGPSSVLIAHGVNDFVTFGNNKWYQFEILWTSHGLYGFPSAGVEPYILGPQQPHVSKKYVQCEKVGSGTYGTVWSCLDVYTGQLIAVKKFTNLSGKSLVFAGREIRNLRRINGSRSTSHDHILEIIGVEGAKEGDKWGEILMPLKLGNVKTLVESTAPADLPNLADRVLRHMLLAINCIADHDIVHRDIKPENILWEWGQDGNYHFRLGDFGLSNDANVARTSAGTETFMAPEVLYRKPQSKKMDIWGLFATIIWVREPEFRRKCAQMPAYAIHDWLVRSANLQELYRIGAMAWIDPERRPSASRLLRILDFQDVPDLPPPLPDQEPNLVRMMKGVSIQGRRKGGRGGGGDVGGYDGEDFFEGQDPGAVGMPYYEPYAPGRQKPGESSYQPPPMGGSPRLARAPQHDTGHFVMPLEPPYRNADSDEGTAVPDVRTAQQATQKMTQFNTGATSVGDSIKSGIGGTRDQYSASWAAQSTWSTQQARPGNDGGDDTQLQRKENKGKYPAQHPDGYGQDEQTGYGKSNKPKRERDGFYGRG